MASNKGLRGTRKWGPKTPGGRVVGARRCLGPARAREGAGGAASSSAGRAGRGVDRPLVEVAGARPLSQICVREATGGLWLAG